jgi:3D (Asp-Asp-Asp) domain-containing protein
MTIDPLTMMVVDVIGKYVIDKGATLLKEAGQAATQAAAQLFEQVMNRLKADPAEAKNAERFEQNPEGYQAVIADAVGEKMKSDPDFTAQLVALVEDYKKAIVTVDTSNIKVDSGVVATQGGVAAGEGGVAIQGNVQGGITLNNTQSSPSLEGGDM